MPIKSSVIGLMLASSLVFGVAQADGDGPGEKESVFVAHLSADANVPPTSSKAQGRFVLKNHHRKGLEYKLIVANLQDIRASHIHCAPAGENGPIGLTLFGASSPITVNGILSQGPIVSPNEGNSCGWVTTDDIVAAIQSGNAYVNVHTVTYPGGEIRAQIR